MPETVSRRFELKVLANRAVILVQVHRGDTRCLEQLKLADGVRCLPAGPDRGLVISDSVDVGTMLAQCQSQLSGVIAVVDVSDANVSLRIAGGHAREVLASGTGLDLRESVFSIGSCTRTRLAGIGAIVESTESHVFEITVDRSFKRYLKEWFSETARTVSYAAQVGASFI